MTKLDPTALDRARHLQLLVDQLIAGQPWGPAECRDARILVGLLSWPTPTAQRQRVLQTRDAQVRGCLAQMLADHARRRRAA